GVQSQLARLRRLHRISNAAYQKYMGSLNAAASAVKRLGGTARRELQAVINNLYHMAAAGSLTPNRLPVLFLTLDRNRQWWSSGGVPPWTSAMSQGTALEALGDGYTAVRDRSYLSLGASALPVFTMRPSRGVGVPTSLGIRYVQYTFDSSRSDEIINAFLQAIIGLGTFAQPSGNHLAQHLFSVGNAESQPEVPAFDTGSWSLYQPGLKYSLR